MDDLRTRAELLRMKAELLLAMGEEVRDMAADIASQAAGTVATPAVPVPVPAPVEPRPTDAETAMLALAREIVAEMRAKGFQVSRYKVQEWLRMRGYSVNEARREQIWQRLTDDDPSLLAGQVVRRKVAQPVALPGLPDEPAPHAHLNGHSA